MLENISSKNKVRIATLAAAFTLVAGSVYKFYPRVPKENPASVSYSQFVDDAEAHKVSNIVIRGSSSGQKVFGKLNSNGKEFETDVPFNENVADRLLKAKIPFDSEKETPAKDPADYAKTYGPFAGIILTYFFMKRQMDKLEGQLGPNKKSHAQLLNKDDAKVTFKDVEGIAEAKQELQEVVEFLKNPEKYTKLGSKVSGGTLLVGPPGTGKTLLAKAIAGEADVPFYSVSGSDFDEHYIGEGMSRVKNMFREAREKAPCILFIDEIDALGKSRAGGSQDFSNAEQEKTLNQFLVELDGVQGNNKGIIILAATNRPEVLDPALLRPGRFNRQVTVPLPDVKGREKILEIYLNSAPLAAEINAEKIARGTPGFSGADLANLVNEAGIMAARRGGREITMQDFEQAKDRIIMGAERKSLVMTPGEKKMTAYHEAGHCLVTLRTEGCNPLHKVTIMPRGQALGASISLPESDRYSMSTIEIKAHIAELFGGRTGEELAFGKDHVGTGAANDIERATAVARRMITQYGMSDAVGLVCHERTSQSHLRGSFTETQPMSEQTAQLIDNEIKRITGEGASAARKILEDDLKTGTLKRVAEALLEHETLSAEEIINLISEKATFPVVQGAVITQGQISNSFSSNGAKPQALHI